MSESLGQESPCVHAGEDVNRASEGRSVDFGRGVCWEGRMVESSWFFKVIWLWLRSS
jgi:hypothetical protein